MAAKNRETKMDIDMGRGRETTNILNQKSAVCSPILQIKWTHKIVWIKSLHHDSHEAKANYSAQD